MRIVELNVNHTASEREVPEALIRAILDLSPDVVVLTECVDRKSKEEVRRWFAEGGLEHVSASPEAVYRGRYWNNQVLIASREPLETLPAPAPAPEPGGNTNYLSVRIGGMVVTGVRAPAYSKAEDWYGYWTWLSEVAAGDVLIGDLNADPSRRGKWDRVLSDFVVRGGWHLAEPLGEWSYAAGSRRSRIDHVLSRGSVRVAAARYAPEPFVPEFTDHAALVAEVEVVRQARGGPGEG